MTSSEAVRFEIEGRIGMVILNRPESLNAINLEVKVALDRIIEKIKSNGMLRVVVLRGEGRAFCSGGDLRSIKNKEGMGRPEDLRSSHSILRKLLNLEPVVISVVHGFAMGAGCNLALAADLVYAARGTKFGQAFVNLGLVPDWGGMFFLPRLAGIRKAKEWIFFGQTFDAEEALSCGLINGVLAPDSLVPEVLEKAKRLAAGPWTAIRFAKRTLDQISERGLEAVFEAEIDGFGKCMASPDFQEGLTAFLEKRKPIFG